MLDPGINLMKTHVPLDLDWYADRHLHPVCLHLENGGLYGVDDAKYDGLKASVVVGGFGYRYTLRTSCECEDEENYNKMFFLYLELYGAIGFWYCEDSGMEIQKVRVSWNENGLILPQSFQVDSGETYTVTEPPIYYPMSCRKCDGAGMRYIIKASCSDNGDWNREFPLMLTEGGEFVGTWFLEDYTTKVNQVTDLKVYR